MSKIRLAKKWSAFSKICSARAMPSNKFLCCAPQEATLQLAVTLHRVAAFCFTQLQRWCGKEAQSLRVVFPSQRGSRARQRRRTRPWSRSRSRWSRCRRWTWRALPHAPRHVEAVDAPTFIAATPVASHPPSSLPCSRAAGRPTTVVMKPLELPLQA